MYFVVCSTLKAFLPTYIGKYQATIKYFYYLVFPHCVEFKILNFRLRCYTLKSTGKPKLQI